MYSKCISYTNYEEEKHIYCITSITSGEGDNDNSREVDEITREAQEAAWVGLRTSNMIQTQQRYAIKQNFQ